MESLYGRLHVRWDDELRYLSCNMKAEGDDTRPPIAMQKNLR